MKTTRRLSTLMVMFLCASPAGALATLPEELQTLPEEQDSRIQLGGELSFYDIAPCGGNGTVDVDDISSILDAFAGLFNCACPSDGSIGWGLTGNSGINQAIQFIGTIDNVALNFRVNNQRALRLEPDPNSPNFIAGHTENTVLTGAFGATISGGGQGNLLNNRVTDDFGAIGGGHANQAGDNAGTTADRSFATVGGGDRNYAVGQGSTIAGGIANHALGASSTIGGGWVNVAEFDYTTIGGGYGNMADSFYATIAGGRSNTARYTSAVGGGEENFAGDTYAIVGGGRSNSATNDYCTVGGGRANITGGGGAYATVGGGFSNNAYNEYTTIGGGHDNNSNGYGSTVCGGRTNTAGGQESAIGGGYLNLAAGLRSCVPGGSSNIAAGNYSFASGYRARANHDGTFVWADSNEADFASSGTRQFVVRAAGGVYFGTNNTVDMPAGRFINTSTNAHLTTGGMWTNASDRNAKENIRAIDPVTILQRVASMPISRWNYRTESDRVNHIGPMAQDFHAAFGTGDSDKVIGTADADGVALAAIQGLHILIEERDCEIEELKARVKSVADLEARIEEKNRAASELEARITKLEGMVLALVPYGDR